MPTQETERIIILGIRNYRNVAWSLAVLLAMALASCQYRERDPETGAWVDVSEQEYKDVTIHDDNEIQELNR